jgi:hypothetical protein
MQRLPNFLFRLLSLAVVVVIFGFIQVDMAQNSGPVQDAAHQGDVTTEPSRIVPGRPAESPEQKVTLPANSSALVIGPGDDLEITVYGAPDLSGHGHVSADGNISMPLIGSVRVARLSSSEAEAAIEGQLRQNNILNDRSWFAPLV